MKIEITQDYIDHALESSPWDFGNGILYSLCKNNPKHDRNDVIMAKVWLIGRSYASAIERRKKSTKTSDDFYETTVVNKLNKLKLDNWLAKLPERITDPWKQLGLIIRIHKKLMNTFSEMTDLKNRSLASKYLHFHRPDLFFIFDSRSKRAINKVAPKLNKIANIKVDDYDLEYLSFCRRVQWMKDSIKNKFKISMSPRQLDKILLRIEAKIK